jgi:hypothetical protein
MAYLATGVAAVATEREFSREEVVHAEMEEDDVALGTIADVDWGVHAQVHVSVDGCVVMAD